MLETAWDLIKKTVAHWSDIDAPRLGAALAFYTMLSMAPLLVVGTGIAGLVFGRQAAQGEIGDQLRNLVGPQGGQAIQAVLAHISKPSSGIAAAVLGVFMLLFGASGVFGELHDSLNLVWGVKSTSGKGLFGMIRYRFISFAMVVGVGFLMLVSLMLSAALSAAGKFFSGFLPAPEVVLQLAYAVISFLAVTVLFALLYKVVPDAHVEWRDVWVGAAVTSALFSIGKLLIGLYLGKASVGSVYGAAGSLAVFLLWVYYSAQIVFLGAEFTHTLAQRRAAHSPEAPLVE